MLHDVVCLRPWACDCVLVSMISVFWFMPENSYPIDYKVPIFLVAFRNVAYKCRSESSLPMFYAAKDMIPFLYEICYEVTV